MDYFENKVSCVWKESSMYTARLIIKLNRDENYSRNITLKREDIWPPHKVDGCSTLIYNVQNIQTSEYYRYKKPKLHQEYDDILASEEFKNFVSDRVNALVNYPFEYESKSSY